MVTYRLRPAPGIGLLIFYGSNDSLEHRQVIGMGVIAGLEPDGRLSLLELAGANLLPTIPHALRPVR